MRRIAFFEDQAAAQFAPIALLRPVFDLRCGHFGMRDRLIELLEVEHWGCFIRPELAESMVFDFPQAAVNDAAWLHEEATLLVNSRCLIEPQLLLDFDPATAGWIDDTLACVVVRPEDQWEGTRPDAEESLLKLARKRRPVQVIGSVLNYPWDLIEQNPIWLERDFRLRKRIGGQLEPDSRVALVGPRDDIYIDETARLEPFVVIDSNSGPVWIEDRVRVQAFTRIEGPAYIGSETQLFRANVREGCSFGPVCRIGGEIEESIVHGYSNKYHDGFLGHSYVASWVNLGALTTNSDLKNDYSQVSVPLQGTSIPSGGTKVGCFIGDHTKTGLGSLLNTGSSVGVMTLILPGGELLPKHIPSFSRIWHGRLEELPDGCESGLETARYAMSRRGQELTEPMERLLRQLYEQTAPERKRALDRQSAR